MKIQRPRGKMLPEGEPPNHNGGPCAAMKPRMVPKQFQAPKPSHKGGWNASDRSETVPIPMSSRSANTTHGRCGASVRDRDKAAIERLRHQPSDASTTRNPPRQSKFHKAPSCLGIADTG